MSAVVSEAILGELVLGSGALGVPPAVEIPQDPRFRTKVYLENHLSNANLTKDDNETEVDFAVIYAYPPYPLMQEFQASSNPVDLLFLIDEPNSTPQIGHDQAPYGYEEHVPIIIATIDKTGITGTKLKWKGEAELRRLTETYPTGSQRSLERKGDRDMRLGSTLLYMTEFVLNYRRDTT